jgi:isopenicillin N synthase-like dioxygenase
MTAAAKIPVIDISGSGDQARVAKELVEAAVEHGFIYIKNTGRDIPVDAVENAFNLVYIPYFCNTCNNDLTLKQSKVLFGAPLEEKQQCAIQQNNRGWSGMQVETLDAKNQRVGDYKE